jgi:O-antigen ligase
VIEPRRPRYAVAAAGRRGGTALLSTLQFGVLVAALAAVGVGIATGHTALSIAAAAVPAGLLLLNRGVAIAEQTSPTVRTAAFMWAVLAASTLVWRIRSTSQLSENPLDSAALVRIGLVCVAGLIALAILAESLPVGVPLAVRLYGFYVVAAFVAAAASPRPSFALYRVFELAVGLIVVLAILARFGDRAGALMVSFSIGALVVLIATAWVGAVVDPAQAWESSGGGLVSRELSGVLPSISSNSLGFYGGLVALWGFAQLGGRARWRGTYEAALALGLITMLAAQYRTGIAAFLFAGAVVTLVARRWVLTFAAFVGGIILTLVVGWGESLTQAERILSRGHPELISNLDSRTVYWQAVWPYVKQRPELGWGLNVKSRDVLASLGLDTTSTVHGTWPEVLLGTGVVGTVLLALVFLVAIGAGWRARQSRAGVAALAMLIFFAVRSVTGSTIELFDVTVLVFAALAVTASQLGAANAREGPVDPSEDDVPPLS